MLYIEKNLLTRSLSNQHEKNRIVDLKIRIKSNLVVQDIVFKKIELSCISIENPYLKSIIIQKFSCPFDSKTRP